VYAEPEEADHEGMLYVKAKGVGGGGGGKRIDWLIGEG